MSSFWLGRSSQENGISESWTGKECCCIQTWRERKSEESWFANDARRQVEMQKQELEAKLKQEEEIREESLKS